MFNLKISFGLLYSDFLNDFFKPISTDMERLRTYKKHRHGRRIKQLEKFEQRMKEERQRRIRERQKEFFSEIEVHKYVFFRLPLLMFLSLVFSWLMVRMGCRIFAFQLHSLHISNLKKPFT